jgi:hypothetical protein
MKKLLVSLSFLICKIVVMELLRGSNDVIHALGMQQAFSKCALPLTKQHQVFPFVCLESTPPHHPAPLHFF